MRPMLNRRTALKWAGGLAAALGNGVGFAAVYAPVATGYGPDPDMLKPVVPWPRIMNKSQREVTYHLVDFILPREGKAPAASEIGVHELIDEWVSAPYPEQVRDKALIFDGLIQLDLMARRDGKAQGFAAASLSLRAELMSAISDPSSTLPTTPFWKRLRRLVIGGYYTTEAGFADIGYIGNTMLESYPPPTAEMRLAMEKVFQRLDLVDRTPTADLKI